ncbi:hypothetical protein PINS_up004636 [Pythium insidiosum]|nr:hypothetical protein PINS_up004636 [Pythium insidiosum]
MELRYAGLADANVLTIKDRLVGLAQRVDGHDDAEIELDNSIDDDATLLVVQAVIELESSAVISDADDLALDVLLVEASDAANIEALEPRWTGPALAETLDTRAAAFSQRFESAFALSSSVAPLTTTDDDNDDDNASARGLNASLVAFAQTAFSNLIGGVGYFYGSSLVQRDADNAASISQTARAPLFTAVPSRSFFPRGFLWDEGFHQLGIGAFDAELTQDVLAHWLALMDDDGYIAREQILGATARARVPSEFLVQHVEHANPPALLLAVESLLRWGRCRTRRTWRRCTRSSCAGTRGSRRRSAGRWSTPSARRSAGAGVAPTMASSWPTRCRQGSTTTRARRRSRTARCTWTCSAG